MSQCLLGRTAISQSKYRKGFDTCHIICSRLHLNNFYVFLFASTQLTFSWKRFYIRSFNHCQVVFLLDRVKMLVAISVFVTLSDLGSGKHSYDQVDLSCVLQEHTCINRSVISYSRSARAFLYGCSQKMISRFVDLASALNRPVSKYDQGFRKYHSDFDVNTLGKSIDCSLYSLMELFLFH